MVRATNLIKICEELGYLNEKTLKTIQKHVNRAEVPSDITKLLRIIDNFFFDGFIAKKLNKYFPYFPRTHHMMFSQRKMLIA